MSPRKALIVECPNCGAENKISSPFCTECKARLFEDGNAPITKENPKKKAFRRALRTFIITWVFLSLAVPGGLIIWPHAAIDVPIQQDPSLQVERYLEEVTKRRRERVPIPRTVFFERNLNFFLGQNNDPEVNRYSGIVLSETAILLVTNEPMGPFEISTRLILEPEDVEEGTGPFVPTKLWVEHFPVSTRYAKTWTQWLAVRFGLNLDKRLWDEIRILGVGRTGGVVVDVEWDK